MTKVYSRCYDEIGAFNDTRYIVGMLEKVSYVVNATQYSAYDKNVVLASSRLSVDRNKHSYSSFLFLFLFSSHVVDRPVRSN